MNSTPHGDPLAKAQQFVRDALVWDNHACMPLRPEDQSFLPQLERVKASGVDVISLNIGMDLNPLDEHLRNIASFRSWVRKRPADYQLVQTIEDIDRAKAEGKLSIVFDLEGMGLFDDGDYGLVETFGELGVKWALIAYNRGNKAGGGCMDNDSGLSNHGKALVRSMEQSGITVCCSHTGHQTAKDVLSIATKPVIFSHSNPSAVYEHDRNIPDDLIRACAEQGGVIGINGVGAFLGPYSDASEVLFRHIDYVAQLVGPEYVGLGLDYCFDKQEVIDFIKNRRHFFPDEAAWNEPIEFAPPETILPLVGRLQSAGYDSNSILLILGENWRRIAEKTWIQ